MVDKRILGYLIVGGRELRKIDMDTYIELDEYIDTLEREEERKFSQKERERLMKLILGIMKIEKGYDERYHKWLLGYVI